MSWSVKGLVSADSDLRYSVISADPPWTYGDKKMNRGGAARYYDTLSIEQIKAINVESVADDNCLLMLWATAPLLPEAMEVIESWGFKYKTVGFVWVKRSSNYWSNVVKRIRRDISAYGELFAEVEVGNPFSLPSLKSWFGPGWLKSVLRVKAPYNIGMGWFTRANAEFVLFGVKGDAAKLIDDHGVSQIIDACLMEHSRKPDEYFELVDQLVGDVSRLELFSRCRRPGWKNLGDQVDSDYLLDEDMRLIHLDKPVNLNRKPTSKPYTKKPAKPKGIKKTA